MQGAAKQPGPWDIAAGEHSREASRHAYSHGHLILLTQCFRFSDKHLTGKSQSQCSLHSPKEQSFRQVRNPRVQASSYQDSSSRLSIYGCWRDHRLSKSPHGCYFPLLACKIYWYSTVGIICLNLDLYDLDGFCLGMGLFETGSLCAALANLELMM